MTQSSRSKRVTEGMHVVIKNQWRSARVNFINILRSAFTCAQIPKTQKVRQLFVHLGSARLKSACKNIDEIDPRREREQTKTATELDAFVKVETKRLYRRENGLFP
jgi:hypothetical protein